MMHPSHTLLLLALVLIAASGCKKKPKNVPPPATQVPTITTPVSETKVEPKPDSGTAPARPPATVSDPAKTKPRPKPKPVAKKPVKPPLPETSKPPAEPVTTAKVTPPRIIVQPGPVGPSESPTGVISGMTHTEEAHHRQTTEQLMQSTEANIKSLKRVLTAEERSLLQQIQLFMEQSREATLGQDLVRAHNLAMKAHLLSDELVR